MPWREKYDSIRDAAVQQRLRTGGKGQAERLGKGVFGRVAQTGTDRIFVVLAEFGDTRHSAFCDSPTRARHGPLRRHAEKFDGPLQQPDPEAEPEDRQLDALDRGTTAGRTSRTCTSRG